MLFVYWCIIVRCQLLYTMRCFLDLSDDSFAVTLEGAGHNHEPSEMQVALQCIATHLPDLCDPEIPSSVQNLLKDVTQYLIFLTKIIYEPADD